MPRSRTPRWPALAALPLGLLLVAAARPSAYPALDTLARVMTTLEAQYVEPLGPDVLVEAAIRGMVARLDPHSSWLSAAEHAEMRARTEGRWVGVGVELQARPEGIVIVRVLAGGPAELGGVRRGDRVVAVDGSPAAGLGMHGVGERLAGERGAPVTLEIEREGAVQALRLVRDQVLAPSVEGSLLGGGLAYVRLEQFRQRTRAELEALLHGLEAEAGAPLRGLVLDLRDNPGGLLDEAVGVVDLFVGEAVVVETRGRPGAPVAVERAQDQPTDRDLPLVLLVNEASASAAEIVAGALQDLGRARIVGAPSYGKGTVQQVYELPDGSALKLSVARYHLPSGRTLVPGDAVVPDLPVPMAPEDAPETARAVPWHLDPAERRAADPQLEAAWDLLTTGG